ncbi:MAG: transposase, partial [Candidatus Methanomethylicaceae archaeon]
WMRVYPDVIRSWKKRMEELISYLSYPEELRTIIYTTNVFERFFKEVKRRSKVIEVFPGQVSAEKVLYLVIKEMNERYKERRIKNFEEIIENLRALRKERYRDEQIRINKNSEQLHTQKT